jgi:excisionase family DNA binding protein
MEKLYSIEAAAKRLGGISRHTVVAWLSKGKLQRTKLGRRTMIAESELERIQVVGGVSRAVRRRKETADDEVAAVA